MSTLPAKMSLVVTSKPEKEIGCQDLLKRKVTKSGFLRKKPQRSFFNDLLTAGRRWPQKFVVLLDGCMYIFGNEMAPKYQRASSLFGYDDTTQESMGSVGGATEWTFKVVNNLEDHEKAFCFSATSQESMNEWMECFRKEMAVANSALIGLIGTMPNGDAMSGGSSISRLSDYEKREIRKSVKLPREIVNRSEKADSDGSDSESDGVNYEVVESAVPPEKRKLPPIPNENPDPNQRKVSQNLASEAVAKNFGRSPSNVVASDSPRPSKPAPLRLPVMQPSEDAETKKSSTSAGPRSVPVPPEVQSEYEVEEEDVSVRRSESAPATTKPIVAQRSSVAQQNAGASRPSAVGLKPSPVPKKPAPLVGKKSQSFDESSNVGGAWLAQKKQWPPGGLERAEDIVESSAEKCSSEHVEVPVVPKPGATKGLHPIPANKPKVAMVPPTLKPKPVASIAVPSPASPSSGSGTTGVQKSTSPNVANTNVPLKERVVPPVPPPLTDYELNNSDAEEELEQYEAASMTSPNISEQTGIITDGDCRADPVAAAAFCTKDVEQCGEIMKLINVEGAYMIRRSTKANVKTLLIRTLIKKELQIVKYTLVKLKDKRYTLGINDSPKFASLGELLNFYRNNVLPNRTTTLSKPYSEVS